jgi:diguanylate cyclase (GGDEF)-like protein
MNRRPFVPVLDVAAPSERPLEESVRSSGFEPSRCADVEELIAALDDPKSFAVVVAFECLAPSPQATLQRLTSALGNRRGSVSIIVSHEHDSPRSRLALRLWQATLIDEIVEREHASAKLSGLLRQAYADRFIAVPAASEVAALTGSHLAGLHAMAAQFLKHMSVPGIIREIQANLPTLLPCLAAQVLVLGRERPRLHSLPVRALPHELQWHLTQQTCTAMLPFLDTELTPNDLDFEEHPPIGVVDEDPSSFRVADDHCVVIPLVLQGEIVGALSVLFDAAPRAQDRMLVSLLALHLGPCIKNVHRLQAAEEASIRDALTGAYNRRHLDRALAAELERAGRYDFRLSVAMLDLDHFKRVNDEHGHLVGDHVLSSVAEVIFKELRSTDQLVRYGGEEFLLLLPETGMAEALVVVERIRAHLEQVPIAVEGAEPVRVTVSAGLAAFPDCGVANTTRLLTLADEALLRSKRAGRNRISIASATGVVAVAQGADQRRQHPRIQAELRLAYVDLPQFDGRLAPLEGMDLSIGGVRVRGPRAGLRKNGYGLVYIGSEQRPVLSQVMWARDVDETTGIAGLRFVRPTEFVRPHARRTFAAATGAIVVTNVPATASMVERVLSAAQVPCVAVRPEEGLERLGDISQYGLIVVGESALGSSVVAQLRELREVNRAANQPMRFVVINEEGDRQAMLHAVSNDRLEFVIGDDAAGRDQAFFAMLHKMLLVDQFGIDKYLLWGADIHSWTVTDRDSKVRVLDEIKSAALAMRCHPRIADLLILACDEMIINALYLPSPDGTPKPVVVECGSDGRFFGVAVVDEHGLFRSEDLFAAIGRALEREDTGLPPTAKNASLGLRLMMSGLSQLAINVDPGRCTEVIGVVDLRKSLREIRNTVPSLGVFRNDG